MLLNYFLYIFRCYPAVKSTVGIDDYNRSQRAKTEASGLYQLYLVGKSVAFDILSERFLNILTSRRGTTRTAANQHMCTNHFFTSNYSL